MSFPEDRTLVMDMLQPFRRVLSGPASKGPASSSTSTSASASTSTSTSATNSNSNATSSATPASSAHTPLGHRLNFDDTISDSQFCQYLFPSPRIALHNQLYLHVCIDFNVNSYSSVLGKRKASSPLKRSRTESDTSMSPGVASPWQINRYKAEAIDSKVQVFSKKLTLFACCFFYLYLKICTNIDRKIGKTNRSSALDQERNGRAVRERKKDS